jgi:hypothetical protein
MPFQSVPNTVEIVIQGEISGQPIANVVGATRTGGYSQADIDLLATDVDAWVASDYLPLVSNSVTYNQTHVRGLNAIIDLESVDASGVGPGTASGSGMPANASFVVTLRTGRTGRSARGRFYMWPYSSAALQTSQTVTTVYANAAADALSNLLTTITGAGFQPVIISRRSLGAVRPVGITTPITQAQSRNVDVDSMRHRLLRGH